MVCFRCERDSWNAPGRRGKLCQHTLEYCCTVSPNGRTRGSKRAAVEGTLATLAADAEDLTQSFFAHFLRTKAYSRTDRLHGKFRSFLLASVKNFLADNWDRQQAIRRGGGYRFVSLDQGTAESFYDVASASDSTAEHLFELRWAKSLTAGALDSLRQELHAEGKAQLFEQLKNFLTGSDVLPSYDEASTRTGLPRATVKTHVHRLRQRYREIVRREVARQKKELDDRQLAAQKARNVNKAVFKP